VSELKDAVARMDAVIEKLAGGETITALSVATMLQQAFRILTHALLHLQSMTVATQKLKAIDVSYTYGTIPHEILDNNEIAFYYGKIISAQFFLQVEFKKYHGILQGILNENGIIAKAQSEMFTGVLEA